MKAVINRGYVPYEGNKLPRIARVWPIMRNEFLALWKLKRVRFFIYSFGISALSIGAVILLIDVFATAMGLDSQEFKKLFSSPVLYKKYCDNDFIQFLMIFFCAIVGGGLIANDIKTRAIPLYFSKPLGWPIYLLGKISIIAFAIFFVTFCPGFLIFVLQVIMSDTPKEIFMEHYPHIIGLFAYSFLILCIFTPLILSISSLTENYNYAFLNFIVLLSLLIPISAFFLRNDPTGIGKNSAAISITFCLEKAGDKFFPEVKQANKLPPIDMSNPRHRRRKPLEFKVEDEKWIFINLAFWFISSSLLLMFRLKKIEVRE